MKNRKNIAKRLSVLYVTFICVIVLAFFGKCAPEFQAGFQMGIDIQEMLGESDHEYNSIYMLDQVRLKPLENAIPIEWNGSDINVRPYADKASIVIKEHIDEQKSPFAVVGGESIFYFAYLAIGLALIYMLILIARIILSVRRSIIEERSVEYSNTLRVRLIGTILIATELVMSIADWRFSLHAAKLLEGSNLAIETSFSPDYWQIMLGILIIFMGELFAITHALSEEQKLTI